MKKMRTKKEIEDQIWELGRLQSFCVTQQMVREIQVATLKWVIGNKETLNLNFILKEDG